MKHEGFLSQSILSFSLSLSLYLPRARARDEVTLLFSGYYFLDLLSVGLDTRDLSQTSRDFYAFQALLFTLCRGLYARELIINNRRDKKA
jgi:hypothetical protein